MRDIDDIAAQLKRLQDEGVPVIWRPLHEAEGGWFWWGAKDGASCQKLWNYMYDRLTNYHKLNNLIWVWNSYGGEKKGNWYPGNKTVDIIGWDYENCDNLKSWELYKNTFANNGKLFCLAEQGTHPNPSDFAAKPWLYFLTWAYMIKDNNTPDWTYKVYNDPQTITLSDLPWPWVKDVTANAGADQTIVTTNASASVSLDGSASTSLNSTIVLYEWKRDGVTIANGARARVKLMQGKNNIMLVVTDQLNGRDSTSISVWVKQPNLALNKPNAALTTEPDLGHDLQYINDGNSNTRWSSQYADPQWVSIDLQDDYRISSVILLWEAASAQDYRLEFSMDNKAWTPIVTMTAQKNGPRNDTLNTKNAVARYIRMYGTARNTKYGYSLFEIEAYGQKANASQSIALQKGWNLISTNVWPTDSSIATLFNGLDVQEIKDMNSFWRKGQGDEFNSLKTITAGEGYLVNMNAVGTLIIQGVTLSHPLNAKKETGWQLIGCPYQSVTPFSQDFDATNCSAIKNFEGFWMPDETNNSIQYLESGKGYFVRGK